MKKFISFIIIFLLFTIVEAKTLYSNVPDFSNDYIKRMSQSQRYFVTKNSKYGFTSKAVENSKFKTGGLLNESEFNIVGGSRSYLFNGLTFFTMTEGSGKVKTVDPTASGGIAELSTSSGVSGVRVTNYIRSGVNVEGYGSRVSPWRVSEKYVVTFKYDDTKITVRPTSVTITRGGHVTVDVLPTTQYTYKPQTTCGVIENGKLRISGITRDTVCEIEHTLRNYTVTIEAGKSKYGEEAVFDNSIGGQGWELNNLRKQATQKVPYNDKISNLPTSSQVHLVGYELNGWAENNVAINPNTYKVTKDSVITAVQKQRTFEITYVPHRGTMSITKKQVTYDEKYSVGGSLSTPTAPVGYTFAGWRLGSETGEPINDDTIVKTASNHELHATWNANRRQVTVDANGGTIPATSGWTIGSENTTATKTVTYDSQYGTLPTPTWIGHTFEGWHLGSVSGDKITSTTIMKTDSNHTLVAKWYINVAVPTASEYCLNPTYDDTEHTIVSAAPEGFTWQNHKQTNAGKYIVTATISTGYIWGGTDFTNKTIECNINQRNITVVARNQSKTYDGKELKADATCDATSGLVSGHTVVCTNTGSQINAGSTTKTLSTVVIKKGTVDVSSNYKITKGNGILLVNKKSVSVSWESTTEFTYNGNPQAPSASVTTGVTGETMTVTRTTQTNVGDYTSTASCSSVTGGQARCDNYTLTNTTKNYSIKKADSSITCKSLTYTGGLQTLATGSGCSSLSNNTRTDAGKQTVTCTGDSNHNDSTKDCSIGTKSVSVTWGSTTSFTYNGNAQAPTVSTSTGISGETMTVTRTTQTNVGSYTSAASCSSVSGGRAKCGNYSLTNTTKAYSIGRAASSITCKTLTYTGGSQTLATGSGCSSLSNNTRTDAGKQTVTCTGDSNHNDSTKDCSIGTKSVSVTWGSTTSFTYNGNAQAPTVSASTGISGETMTVTRTANTNVGGYVSTASCTGVSGGRAKCSNYSLSNTTKSYSITTSKTAVLGSCGTVYYDGNSHTLAGGGSHIASYSNNTQTQVGTYTVTATAADNYAFSDGSTTKTLSCKIESVPYNCKVISGVKKCCASGYTAYLAINGNDIECKITCTAGYHLATANSSTCTICPAGTYTESNTIVYGGTSPCLQCRPGTYNSKQGQSSCTSCAAGDYASDYGSTSCSECGPGTYSAAGASSCTQCAAGKYASGNGNTSCSNCPAGKYSNKGAGSCTKCSAGTYSSSAGSSSCTKCPAGKYASGTGNTGCSCCSAGKYAYGQGNSSCSSCASGYTSSRCSGSCTKVSSGGGGGCFTKGTKVKTLLGYKAINELSLGEEVLTYNEELKINEYKKIVDIFTFRNMKETLYTVTLDNNEQISATHLHRIYVKRNGVFQYFRAEEVRINDKVLFADGTLHSIIKIESKEINQTVYNLQLEGNNNFYVGDNGVLVHNMFLAIDPGEK